MMGLSRLNEKLVEMTYRGVVLGDLTIGDYEERLVWYLVPETPPYRVHAMDMHRLDYPIVGPGEAVLLGHEYKLTDDGKWYEREVGEGGGDT